MKARPGESGPLKVLFYSHSGEVSGAEISLLLTMIHIQGVNALLAAPEGELLQRARNKGLEVRPIRSHRARMSRNPLDLVGGIIGIVVAGVRLRLLISAESPDILHANSIRAGLIALIGTCWTGTTTVWHVRDNLPMNVVGRMIRRIAATQAAGVITISHAVRDNFSKAERLRKKTFVVYNGIPVDVLPTQPTDSLRDNLAVSSSSFVVGVVGQIALWKRQADAIQAFALFSKNYPDSKLWIVGSPKFRSENTAYYESLQAQSRQLGLQARIRFLGFQPDVTRVMDAIDVLLVPSENEPFGRVVIEAMLAGKPVIGTRGGGIPEIIVDGETGILVNQGDISAMSVALQEMFRSPHLRRVFGDSGRERCLMRFSIDRTCAEIEDVYRSLMIAQERTVLSAEHPQYRAGR